MILDTDQDIFNGDFIRWSNTMEESFVKQLRFLADTFDWQKQNTRIQTKTGLLEYSYPLPVILQFEFQDHLHPNYRPNKHFLYLTLSENTRKCIEKVAKEAMSEMFSRIGDKEFDFHDFKPLYEKDLQEWYMD